MAEAARDMVARERGAVGRTVGLIEQVMAGSPGFAARSEEHTSELQSLMRISYAVFCLKKKITLLYHVTPSTATNIFYLILFIFVHINTPHPLNHDNTDH